MSAPIVIEACVQNVEEAVRAEQAGVDRLELCARLDVGGLTPDPATVLRVAVRVGVPVFVMIRPRDGDFDYSAPELRLMQEQIRAAKDAGAAGVVFGALSRDRRIARVAVENLVRAAGSVPTTFHKAFDLIADQPAALDTLMELGVRRVLTSGGEDTAEAGSQRLASLVGRAQGRIAILPGGRVRAAHALRLLAATGATELHARESAIRALVRTVRGGIESHTK